MAFDAYGKTRATNFIRALFCALLLLILAGCRRDSPGAPGGVPEQPVAVVTPRPFATVAVVAQAATPELGSEAAGLPSPQPVVPTSVGPITPAPTLPPPPTGVPQVYTVQPGDTLTGIAGQFQVSVEQIMDANRISNPNAIYAGQLLQLPGQIDAPEMPALRLLPDSEVVYGPAYRYFDTQGVIYQLGGYLASHEEEVEGETLRGPAIIDRVAQRYSVGPRVLLALLEYQSGWLTQTSPANTVYPFGLGDPIRATLFRQASWTAKMINTGYYGALHERDALIVPFPNGAQYRMSPLVNPGSAALQYVFARLGGPEEWQRAMSSQGFLQTYLRLFGDPAQYAVEPLMRPDLVQPTMVLPWAASETWYYTGGPHGGWDDGSTRAALDFAPPQNNGCRVAPEWVLSSTAGLVTRSEKGEVVIDLDGDGFAGTGWTVLYMHLSSEGRVPVGTVVKAGDPLGHPSCEGGYSEAAHVHIARRYNGQWIPADGSIPFVLSGWRAANLPRNYDGILTRNGITLEACTCRGVGNQISVNR